MLSGFSITIVNAGGEKVVNVNRHGQCVIADVKMNENADVELNHHSIVASSADTVRRCFRQCHVGLAIATNL